MKKKGTPSSVFVTRSFEREQIERWTTEEAHPIPSIIAVDYCDMYFEKNFSNIFLFLHFFCH